MEREMMIHGKEEVLIPFFSIDKEYFINNYIINKTYFDNNYDSYRKGFNWTRHTYTSYHLFNEFFDDSITVWGNEEYLCATITYNFNEFILKIQNYLNITNFLSKDDPEFMYQLKDRINVLKHVQTEEELKEKFPRLYDIFIYANNPDNNVPTNYYYNCGIRYVVNYFALEQALYFEHVANNIDKLERVYSDYSIVSGLIRNNCYKDDLRLYCAHRLFDIISANNNNPVTPTAKIVLEKYIDLVKTSGNINTTINLENGEALSYIQLLSEYSKYMNGGAINTWIITPSGHDKTKIFHPPVNYTAMSDEEYNRLCKLNKEKYDFYESLPYLARAKGKYINTGYYAFFLPNGEQLLDKLCYPDDDFIVSHYGNAIFNLNIHNFELLSHIDKTTLRKSKLCPFTTHQEGWKERSKDMISKTVTTNQTIDDSIKLIKKIEIK